MFRERPLITDTRHPDFDPNAPELLIAGAVHGDELFVRSPQLLDTIVSSEAAIISGVNEAEIRRQAEVYDLTVDTLGRVALFTSHGMTESEINDILRDRGPVTEGLIFRLSQNNSPLSALVKYELESRAHPKTIKVNVVRNKVSQMLADDNPNAIPARRSLSIEQKKALLLMTAGFSSRQTAGMMGVEEETVTDTVKYALVNAQQRTTKPPTPMYGIRQESNSFPRVNPWCWSPVG